MHPGDDDADRGPIGQKVGRVRVEARIGRGGMGDVFRGFDEMLERPVALKRLRSGRRGDPLARTRFLREARLLSRLDHPNVCRIWDLLEAEDGDYLVLELVDGRPLAELLTRNELDTEARWRIAEQIAEALAAAHDRDIVHRDLKPSNVMITAGGDAKVLDFGIARPAEWARERDADGPAGEIDAEGPGRPEPDQTWLLGRPDGTGVPGGAPFAGEPTTRTTEGAVLGSVRWMSPEQARGEPVGPASDVFSLGLLLGTLLAETIPHHGIFEPSELLERATVGRIEPPSTDDHALRRLLRELLATDPGDRPTARRAADRLRELRSRGRRRRRRIATAIATAALLAVAVVVTLWVSRPRPLVSDEGEPRIAVSPFVDATARTDDAWVELGLAEVLADDLAARSHVSLIPVDDVRSGRELLGVGVDPDRGLLQSLGASLLVRTRVEDHPRGVLLRAELTGRDGRRDVVDAIAPAPAEAVRILANGIANRLDVPLRIAEDVSSDPFAVQALAMGIQRLAAGEARSAAHYFEVALDRDPSLERARIELAESLDDQGRTEEALALLVRVADDTDHEVTEARALVAAFRILLDRGRPEEAERLADRALEILETIGDERERIQALNQLGVLAYRRGDLEGAEARWSEVLATAETIEARALEADALRNLSYLALRRRDVEGAERMLLRSLDLFRSLGIPRGELTVLGSLGLLANQVGDLDEAQSRLREAEEIARRIGDPRMRMTGLVNLGAVAFARGDLPAAIEHTREALELGREIGDPRQQVHSLASLGYFATRSGDLRRAAERLEEASEIADSSDVTDAGWLLEKNLGYLRCRQGRSDEAFDHLESALAERREKFGLLAAARCRYHAGNPHRALELLEEARESVGPTGGWTGGDRELLLFVEEVVRRRPSDPPPLPDEAPVRSGASTASPDRAGPPPTSTE